MRSTFKLGFCAAAASALLVPATAPAQIFLSPLNLRSGPIEASDPLVGLPLPGATPAEYRAHLLWNLRSGLNVAALQCQFSDYLRAVPNYNGFLAHHSAELAAAYTALSAYFKRVHGAQGMRRFDDYSTTTYNNFSTLQAQMTFCQTASSILKTALAAPKGGLADVARARMRELRNSLVPAFDPRPAYNPWSLRLPPVPPLAPDCWSKKNELRIRCGGTAK